MEERYDIYYRVHAQNFGWMGWAKNGEAAGTEGYGYRVEAIQIKIVKKVHRLREQRNSASVKMDLHRLFCSCTGYWLAE